MDATRKIEAALPIVLYYHAEADGTYIPSESCVCEDDVYTNNGDDDTIGVPLVRQSDALAALASKDAEIARLRGALEWYAEIGTSISPDSLVTIADAGKVARAALTQPTE